VTVWITFSGDTDGSQWGRGGEVGIYTQNPRNRPVKGGHETPAKHEYSILYSKYQVNTSAIVHVEIQMLIFQNVQMD